MTPRSFSHSQLHALMDASDVIEADGSGLKVGALPNGDFLKVFRRKKWLSRDMFTLPAVRFARHCELLHERGIPAPRIRDTLVLNDSNQMSAVTYRPVAGRTLRQALAAGDVSERRMAELGQFIARLHDEGLYFRSIHPGNIILCDSGIGLIDVLDMRVRGWPLTRGERQRNWRHFFRTREDHPHLDNGLLAALMAGYNHRNELPVTDFDWEQGVRL